MKLLSFPPAPLSAVAKDLVSHFSFYNPKSTSSNMTSKLSSIRNVDAPTADSWGISGRHYHHMLVFTYGGINYRVDYYPFSWVQKKRLASPFTGAPSLLSYLLHPRPHYLPMTVSVDTGTLPVTYYTVAPFRQSSPAVELVELGNYSTDMPARSKGVFTSENLLKSDPGTVPHLYEQEHMVALLGLVLLFFDYA